jgi:hypothetical protein
MASTPLILGIINSFGVEKWEKKVKRLAAHRFPRESISESGTDYSRLSVADMISRLELNLSTVV